MLMNNLFANKHRDFDPVWHVQIVLVIALLLQIILPDKFTVGSRFIIPVVEAVLIVALSVTTPKQKVFKSFRRRLNVVALTALISATNIYSLSLVVGQLLHEGKVSDGKTIILTAVNIYLTNLIIFALWYWEMDGGGPGERQRIKKYEKDFMFPQDSTPDIAHPDWKPTFVDYLYLSSTNAMAFSPTDTMPLSRRAKVLMLIQATASLIVVALVAARAVNILS